MVKLINKRTGSAFWVADERVEEYKAAGHKLAASPSATQKPIKEEPVEAKEEAKEEKPVKKTDEKVVKRAVKKK
jgi:hypothetical protein